MAKQVATNVVVKIGGVDLSSYVSNVSLSSSADAIEVTSFSSAGARERVSGLKDNSVTIDFMQDFAAGAVDATLFPLFNTLATVVIVPTSGTVSATNPSYTAVCLANSYTPFASSVGDIATLSVTWPTSGTVTRATA